MNALLGQKSLFDVPETDGSSCIFFTSVFLQTESLYRSTGRAMLRNLHQQEMFFAMRKNLRKGECW